MFVSGASVVSAIITNDLSLVMAARTPHDVAERNMVRAMQLPTHLHKSLHVSFRALTMASSLESTVRTQAALASGATKPAPSAQAPAASATETRLKLIIESAPVSLTITTHDGTIVAANARALKLFDVERLEGLVGTKFDRLVASEEREAVVAAMEQVCKGADTQIVYRVAEGAGAGRAVEMRAVPLRRDGAAPAVCLAATWEVAAGEGSGTGHGTRCGVRGAGTGTDRGPDGPRRDDAGARGGAAGGWRRPAPDPPADAGGARRGRTAIRRGRGAPRRRVYPVGGRAGDVQHRPDAGARRGHRRRSQLNALQAELSQTRETATRGVRTRRICPRRARAGA